MAQAAVGLLDSISEFCRRAGMAESTFGRRAVNDGKFVVAAARRRAHHARDAGARQRLPDQPRRARRRPRRRELMPLLRVAGLPRAGRRSRRRRGRAVAQLPLLRQPPEVPAVRQHLQREGGGGAPRRHGARPPPSRAAGGARVRRRHGRRHRAHARHARDAPALPDAAVLRRRQGDQPRGRAPVASTRWPTASTSTRPPCWSSPTCTTPRRPGWRRKALSAATSLVWHEVALDRQHGRRVQRADRRRSSRSSPRTGRRAHSAKTGNPIYERPVALVIYRDDFRFLLDDVIPRQGQARADYDLVIASQPYRARVPVEFKAAKVIAPLTRALRPGGRLLGIHSCGRDPGLEIVRKMWPDENPFKTTPPRHPARGAGRARPRGAPLQLQRLRRPARRVPLRHAHAADRDRRQHRHLDAVRRLERRRLRRRRSTTSAWPRCSARAATSTPPARCCRRTAACGSSTNPMSSRASEADHEPMPANAAPSASPHAAHDIAAVAAELVACGSLEMGARRARGRRSASPSCCRPARRSTSIICRAARSPTRLPALIALREAGLEPVPHVAARRIASRAEAEAFLKQAVRRGRRAQGAADRRRRAGAARALRRRRGAAARRPARRLRHAARSGCPATPRAIRASPRATLAAALADKLALARSQGLGAYVVTQFSFAPDRIVEYCADLARRAPDVPVYVGLAGPTSPVTLLRYAQRCGVSASLRALQAQGMGAVRLFTHVDPADQLAALARHARTRQRQQRRRRAPLQLRRRRRAPRPG